MIVSRMMYQAVCDQCQLGAWDYDRETWHESADDALSFAVVPGIEFGLCKVGDKLLCKKCSDKSLAVAIAEFAEENAEQLKRGGSRLASI